MKLEERWHEGEGRRIRYLIGGEGPPMLLCHGFLGSAENFETWFDELLPRRTLVIPDLPGFGDSTPLRGRHTSAALSRALQPLIDELDLQRFDLAGLCLGAGVALETLARNPRRVDRLVLHTPLLRSELVRRSFHAQIAVMTAPGVFNLVSWLSRQRLVSDLYKRLLVEGDDVDRRAADMNFRNQLRALPRAAREWLRDGLHRDDVDIVVEHPGETLVIVAGDDAIVDLPAARRVLATVPQAHIAVIDAAGHGWNEAFVRTQLALLSAFLDGRPLPEHGDTVVAA